MAGLTARTPRGPVYTRDRRPAPPPGSGRTPPRGAGRGGARSVTRGQPRAGRKPRAPRGLPEARVLGVLSQNAL